MERWEDANEDRNWNNAGLEKHWIFSSFLVIDFEWTQIWNRNEVLLQKASTSKPASSL